MSLERAGKRQVTHYDPIAESEQSTVVAEYIRKGRTSEDYQSEAQLEQELIRLLKTQAYEYLPIHHPADLIANLRAQLEELNNINFSDAEWERFYRSSITNTNDTAQDKTIRIQKDHIQVLTRDDGTTKNIQLLDKTNIHNNHLQVINQYEVAKGEGGAEHSNRYDVTILVNGLPLVHIELKRRGVDIREAFNQINRYLRDSFWAGDGLFNYVQLFIISNGTHTKYYSNTTRQLHIAETSGNGHPAQGAKSFEFTSWWADATNHPIYDLVDFAKTFLSKHTLLNILTKYCILTVDNTLLVMRPYQIVATERIMQRIEISHNYPNRLGTTTAGGYVWHTTGSGKTLTSFKTAQLASQLPYINKVLFVVDRKDLDYQTMREYDRFQKGAANSNTSTAVLAKQLGDPNATIIITTIQKLSTFIAGNKHHEVYGKHVVIIFDECHRSQFGDMHTAITRNFKKYNIFGFTGTPIFTANAANGTSTLKTTEQAFGEKLHTYTIVDAIRDKNVLPFRIDYIDTLSIGDVKDKKVAAIDTTGALLAPQRLNQIVHYTLEHFAQKTKRESTYQHAIVENVSDIVTSNRRNHIKEIKRKTRVRGFNALFATESVEAAYTYYRLFKEAQADLPESQRLKIAMIYSFAPNEAQAEDDTTGLLPEEGIDTTSLPKAARDYLEDAIDDYNTLFGTTWDTSADGFQSYYKDLAMRMKNREVDLVIVVNMFLTGFDATTLNTLFVDKNLKDHGLIQAFSRTNRILNSVKTYGNIVCFRNLEQATNDALSLFGNKEARGVVLLKPYREYLSAYTDKVRQLLTDYPHPADVEHAGEQEKKNFIALFGTILRLRNILDSFDQFQDDNTLSDGCRQDYQGAYLGLHTEFRKEYNADKESINDDVVFEIELIKQVEINIDYILLRVAQYREAHGNGDDTEIHAEITRQVNASPSLRSKRDLIETFVDSITLVDSVDVQWQTFIANKYTQELDEIISTENLKRDATQSLVAAALKAGTINQLGTDIATIIPAMSRFTPDNERQKTKTRVLHRIQAFVERYENLGFTNHIEDTPRDSPEAVGVAN